MVHHVEGDDGAVDLVTSPGTPEAHQHASREARARTRRRPAWVGFPGRRSAQPGELLQDDAGDGGTADRATSERLTPAWGELARLYQKHLSTSSEAQSYSQGGLGAQRDKVLEEPGKVVRLPCLWTSAFTASMTMSARAARGTW
jgi:hypothetical protein